MICFYPSVLSSRRVLQTINKRIFRNSSVSLTNSRVCFIFLRCPSNFSTFIPPAPTSFDLLPISYMLQSNRKCSTVSIPSPHGHCVSPLILNRWRDIGSSQTAQSYPHFCPILDYTIWDRSPVLRVVFCISLVIGSHLRIHPGPRALSTLS